MTPAVTGSAPPGEAQSPFAWKTIAWISALLAICYAPVLYKLVSQWYNDEDMGHGFFVPVIAAIRNWGSHHLGEISAVEMVAAE